MKILHTSDWHLGKTLDKFERYEEQVLFIEELCGICDTEEIDLVLIAGDIYDVANPPSKAEKLFFSALKRLAADGRRAVAVIAGNHDSPERVIAAAPLASEHGILLYGLPRTVMERGRYGAMEVTDAGEGWAEIVLHGERAILAMLPYPSEKRLNESLDYGEGEEGVRVAYGEKVGKLLEQLSEHYREDTVNLAVSHMYTLGGEESPESERPIQMGGTFVVDGNRLPSRADYIALGHLHRAQQVRGSIAPAYYSGSPLQYSKGERNYSKGVYVITVDPTFPLGTEGRTQVRQVLLHCYKPIEVWKANDVEQALEMAEREGSRNCWVFLEITSERAVGVGEIKELRRRCPNIVEIQVTGTAIQESGAQEIETARSIQEQFEAFFQERTNTVPSEAMVQLFLEILGEEDGDET